MGKIEIKERCEKMKYKYEIFNCNNGNPTAIITNCINEEKKVAVSEKIYDLMPDIDQAAIIIEQNEKSCTFQLINGEFCGNACLSICGYMKKMYGNNDITIINKIIDENNQTHYINIKASYENDICSLVIPKKMLINKVEKTKNEIYKVEMNGITHLIIPKSFGIENQKIAYDKIDEFKKENNMPDVLGIIFMNENKIDPFIWINRINLLQNQTACLSGSIATTAYINDIKSNNMDVDIIQPTNESYNIKIEDTNINVKGTVRNIGSGEIEI